MRVSPVRILNLALQLVLLNTSGRFGVAREEAA